MPPAGWLPAGRGDRFLALPGGCPSQSEKRAMREGEAAHGIKSPLRSRFCIWKQACRRRAFARLASRQARIFLPSCRNAPHPPARMADFLPSGGARGLKSFALFSAQAFRRFGRFAAVHRGCTLAGAWQRSSFPLSGHGCGDRQGRNQQKRRLLRPGVPWGPSGASLGGALGPRDSLKN